MADSKISGLPAVTTPAGTDELPANQSGVSRKITLTQILTFIEALLQVGLDNGGTGADLSATGPGFLRQTSAGADVTVSALAAADLPTGINAANIGAGAVDNTEFGYLNGVTSAIQTQLDARAGVTHKSRHVAGEADEFVDGDLLNAIARLIVKVDGSTIQAIGRRALNLRAQSGSGLTITATDSPADEHTDILLNLTGISAANIGAGAVDNTEFGYLNGVTSAIQTQLDARAALAHRSRHVAGGADEFADGDLLKAIARTIIKNNGTTVYANGRRALNLRAGSGLTLTITDSSADEHTDILISLASSVTAGAMQHISTIILSSAGTFDFTGIPNTYTHLVLVGSLRSALAAVNTDVVRLRFNSDAGSNYFNIRYPGSSGVVANYFDIGSCPAATAAAAAFASITRTIPNYGSTAFYKQIVPAVSLGESESSPTIFMTGGEWRSTAAINQITVTTLGGTNFAANSRLSLYGLTSS